MVLEEIRNHNPSTSHTSNDHSNRNGSPSSNYSYGSMTPVSEPNDIINSLSPRKNFEVSGPESGFFIEGRHSSSPHEVPDENFLKKKTQSGHSHNSQYSLGIESQLEVNSYDSNHFSQQSLETDCPSSILSTANTGNSSNSQADATVTDKRTSDISLNQIQTQLQNLNTQAQSKITEITESGIAQLEPPHTPSPASTAHSREELLSKNSELDMDGLKINESNTMIVSN